MVETGSRPAIVFSKPAQIEFGGDKAACTIRDLSVTGAALQLSDRSATIPAAFTLDRPRRQAEGFRAAWSGEVLSSLA